jgi:hypothetical protein
MLQERHQFGRLIKSGDCWFDRDSPAASGSPRPRKGLNFVAPLKYQHKSPINGAALVSARKRTGDTENAEISMEWCPGPESNQRHADFQSDFDG